MTRHVELRRGTFRDSVRLMQVSRAVSGVPGVGHALVAMATALNLELLTGMGFTAPDGATPDDMVVAVTAEDDAGLAAALACLESELAEPVAAASGFDGALPPRTVGSAVRRSGASVALVSTPGRYAFLDALDALDAGASVMLFSDNIPVECEVALKDAAAARGLLVMGPGCGTAIVGGVGLGFANVVRPGPVGVVAASGAGAQHVMALLDAAGVGVSHCLGVGGRDLSAAVAGRSTYAALNALDADPDTEVILVVSKPADRAVADAVRAHAATLGTPVVFALLSTCQPDLTAAVTTLLGVLDRPAPDVWLRWLPVAQPTPPAGALRGLFHGGTLCDEAMLIASDTLGAIASNAPLRPEWTLPAEPPLTGHAMIDFGADELTDGRPHPMIDGTLRLEHLAEQSADPACSVILLDVVLGHAAHPDPAVELAAAIEAGRRTAKDAGRELAFVVSLVGTADDPQGLVRQATALLDAGAAVFVSNSEATRYAVTLAGGGAP
ncbi:MAG TPA: hypothetical protein VGR21_11280 [Cryptosporangiaceae bacterium]|nr:hypothetical protein [Cryptosporangiaceae bacterium]